MAPFSDQRARNRLVGHAACTLLRCSFADLHVTKSRHARASTAQTCVGWTRVEGRSRGRELFCGWGGVGFWLHGLDAGTYIHTTTRAPHPAAYETTWSRPCASSLRRPSFDISQYQSRTHARTHARPTSLFCRGNDSVCMLETKMRMCDMLKQCVS